MDREMKAARAQILAWFTEYNARYWDGRVVGTVHMGQAHPHTGRLGTRSLKPAEAGLLGVQRHGKIIIRVGVPETMRLTLLHEMCHALVEGERHDALMRRVNAEPQKYYDFIQEIRARKKTDLTGGHGLRWQREMWRVALDHEEYGLVPDLATYNQTVWDDLLARWKTMPRLLLPGLTTNEGAIRCAAVYHREELRRIYLA